MSLVTFCMLYTPITATVDNTAGANIVTYFGELQIDDGQITGIFEENLRANCESILRGWWSCIKILFNNIFILYSIR